MIDKNIGNFITDDRYQEIIKLNHLLKKRKIPHTFEKNFDGWQIIYPNKENRVVSVIECIGSHGSTEDKLEIMGLLTPSERQNDSVLGYLTAYEVVRRIQSHFDHAVWEKRLKEIIDKQNDDTQYYKGIKLMLIHRHYENKKAKRFTINGTNQNVWIPNKHLDENGKIKAGENIDYVFRKAKRQLEIAGITWAIPGIKRKTITNIDK